jgi:RNA polymerase sigma-70 factor (ECF subfamily)
MPPPQTVTARMTDEELVAAFNCGSQEAFTLLVGKYQEPIVNFAFRILGDRDSAVDVAQDTFVRLHAKAHTYRPIAKFSTWIYTIASNIAKSELRRRKWRWVRPAPPSGGGTSRDVPDTTDPGPLPDAAAGRALEAGMLGDALRALPDAFRQAVVLFYIEEKSYEEICAILGVRMGTLKSRLSRARVQLEQSLAPLMGNDERD